MPTDDCYPTKEELRKIKHWDAYDCDGLLEFVQEIWWMAERQVHYMRRQGNLPRFIEKVAVMMFLKERCDGPDYAFVREHLNFLTSNGIFKVD